MSVDDSAYDDEAVAAEYVLHLLDADARAAFEARLAVDRALQSLVYDWEAHLAPLADEVSEVVPPNALRKRVLNAVDPKQKRSFFGGFWSFFLGGIAAAALVAFILVGDALRSPSDLKPSFQAELATDDRSLVLVAGVIPATHEIVIERLAGAPRDGRVHELWLIAEGAGAPVSLGVLNSDGVTTIRVPDDIAPGVRTGTIAISDEPPGGSPTGAPTGDILATGTFVDI